MAEFKGVVLALRGYDVLAFGVADAVRRDGNFNAGAYGKNNFLQREPSTGRRIELGGVVRFVDGEAVTVELGELCCQTEELLHADGKICAVQKAAAAFCGQRFQLAKLRVPAGGSDYDAAAQGQDGAHVLYRCFGRGEVDDYVYACEIRRGQRRGVLVFVDIERAHAVAAFASHLCYE